ncbi:MAG: hypothetical protein M1358_12240 [Chloroflexi bacterium]|nr:hypothetical protein [Chloroflexota bacterium]
MSDRDLLLEIREDYINVYYKGYSLLKLSQARDRYLVGIHKKFQVPSISELPTLGTQADTQEFVRAIPAIKERILSIGKGGNEIEYEQNLIRANNGEPRLNTEYFVIDRQVVSAGHQGRFDLIAVYWSSAGRRPRQIVPLILLEVKFGLNTDIANIHKQLEGYYESLPDPIAGLAEEAEILLRQKVQLGLIHQGPRQLAALETLSVSRSKKDLRFGVVLVDYNPHSKLLNIDALSKLEFSERIDLFYVGFGLWRDSAIRIHPSKTKTVENPPTDSGGVEPPNKFQQQETERQVNYRRRHWPELDNGVWSKGPKYTYPHILPQGHLKEVFYPPVADEVISYCKKNDVVVHSGALNLKSSQVACFNTMFPLRLNLDLASVALQPLLPGVKAVTGIEFEYTGNEDATTWLGEPKQGKRGQFRTSVDVIIWWRDADRSLLTLVEWKYTESEYGSCGGFRSKGNLNRQRCLGLDITASAAALECYLTQGSNRREYWNRMIEAGISLPAMATITGCPFRGPFYQLLRLYLLAAYLRNSEEVDEVYVASVSFRGNSVLRQAPTYISELDNDVIRAWNICLEGVPELIRVDAESIVETIRKDNSDQARHLVSYLNDRYGL